MRSWHLQGISVFVVGHWACLKPFSYLSKREWNAPQRLKVRPKKQRITAKGSLESPLNV